MTSALHVTKSYNKNTRKKEIKNSLRPGVEDPDGPDPTWLDPGGADPYVDPR